jgi:hypothetical protein
MSKRKFVKLRSFRLRSTIGVLSKAVELLRFFQNKSYIYLNRVVVFGKLRSFNLIGFS